MCRSFAHYSRCAKGLRYGWLCILIILFAECAPEKSRKVLKLGHALDIAHPVHQALEFFAQKLKDESNGQLLVEIYPSSQLGNERELLELLQIGSLTMTKVSVAVMENFVSDYKVFGLPYLFRNVDHLHKVLDSPIGASILRKGEGFRLQGLAFYDSGSRSFYTKERPIVQPGDLAGLKIRVMKSNTAINMVNALGGSPAPISYGELYSALQQGVVDGAENNPPSFFSSRHYEVCKYYTLDEHTTVPDVVLISTVWWDSLTKEEKQWLTSAMKQSVTFQRALWKESEAASLEAVEQAGVEIIRPDKSKFIKSASSVYEAFRDDPKISALIDQIIAFQ